MSDNFSSIELKNYENRNDDEDELMMKTLRDELTTAKSQVKKLEELLMNEQRTNTGLKFMLKAAENWVKENASLKKKLEKLNKAYIKQQHKLQRSPTSPTQELQKREQPNELQSQSQPDENNTIMHQQCHRCTCQNLIDDHGNSNNNNVIFNQQLYQEEVRNEEDNGIVTHCQHCLEKDMQIYKYEDRIESLNEELSTAKWNLRKAVTEKNEITERFQIMKIQLDTYESDFQTERRDRENAMGRLVDLENQLKPKPENNRFEGAHQFPMLPHTYPMLRNNFQQNVNYTQQAEDILIGRGTPKLASANKQYQRNEESVTNRRDCEVHHLPFEFKNDQARNESPLDTIPSQENESSSENLNLLPAEFGGDDYCL